MVEHQLHRGALGEDVGVRQACDECVAHEGVLVGEVLCNLLGCRGGEASAIVNVRENLCVEENAYEQCMIESVKTYVREYERERVRKRSAKESVWETVSESA